MSTNQLDQSALDSLEAIEEEIEASTVYFKAKPEKPYMIKMDPHKDKIIPVENERFKDINGNPIKQYECKITHINNSREQKWPVGKTVCIANHRGTKKRVHSAQSDETWIRPQYNVHD